MGQVQSLSLVTRIHVLAGIAEHDERGSAAFLAAHGVDAPGEIVLVERGKRYDARALLAFALGKATRQPVDADGLPLDVMSPLRELGFKVLTRTDLENPAPARPATRRTPATRAPRTPRAPKAPARPRKPEPVVNVCPTCFMAIPATGVCDNCG